MSNRNIAGNWDDRVQGLFEVPIDWEGRVVVDLGCHFGIVAYEVSKQAPKRIVGIDSDAGAVSVAKSIGSALSVENDFECANILDVSSLSDVLPPSIDIVLLLGVYHHLVVQNPHATQQVLTLLLQRCTQTVLFRSPSWAARSFFPAAEHLGFYQVARVPSHRISDLYVLHRVP